MMLREPWRTRLLFLSFAVNLISIPLAVGSFWRRHPPVVPGPPRTEIMIEHMAHDLPTDDAALLRGSMDRHLDEVESARLHMMAARNAMSRAMGHVPYDPTRTQAAMQAWQAAWQVWSEALSKAMLDTLPGLSDQGRQTLAQVGQRRPR